VICISLSDLKLVKELSHMSEMEMCKIENDPLIAKYAHECGLDIDYPILYVGNRHRNLQGQDIVGVRICGEIRCDQKFRDSSISTITDRLVMTSYSDPSLMTEVAELAFKVPDFTQYLNDNDNVNYDESRALFPESQLEEDWKEQEQKIQELNSVLELIRGPVYDASGSLKSPEQYQEWLKEQKGNND
jgi:hypothetical protein